MFIPLVPLTNDLGPTEFKPKTHQWTRSTFKMMIGAKARGETVPNELPTLAVGDALLFDYRVLHRGRGNVSDAVGEFVGVGGINRPVMVLTYANTWFKDIYNFPLERSIRTKVGGWEYVTDLEGNWEYWCGCVRRSRVLIRGADGVLGMVGEGDDVNDGVFVHGGDCVDKGTGDVRITKELVGLKKRYPKRVRLVLGNRDVNKLRFGSELDRSSHVPPYWDPSATHHATYCATHDLDPDSKISTLKWMLACTMGCGGTFENRRIELTHLNLPGDDQSVLDSFVSSVDPTSEDPWMLDYVRLGELIVVSRELLFVHGGIGAGNEGRVPGIDGAFDDVKEWAAQLNGWKNEMVCQYERQTTYDAANKRGGEELMDYVVPGGASVRAPAKRAHLVYSRLPCQLERASPTWSCAYILFTRASLFGTTHTDQNTLPPCSHRLISSGPEVCVAPCFPPINPRALIYSHILTLASLAGHRGDGGLRVLRVERQLRETSPICCGLLEEE